MNIPLYNGPSIKSVAKDGHNRKSAATIIICLGPAVLVCFLAFLVYFNSFPGSFIGDDWTIVHDNPLVARPDLWAIFSSDYWGAGINSGLYRPMTILSFSVNRLLFGADVFSYHLINVLMHMAVTCLFFLTLRTLKLRMGTAWLAAAFFAVHPIHAEVVNEAVGRGELQAALFLFLGLLSALKRHRWHMPFTLLCYSMALLSKENAVVFLPLLVLAEAYAGKSFSSVLRNRRRLLAAAVGVSIAWFAVKIVISARTGVPPDAIYVEDNPLFNIPPAARLLTSIKVQLLYLGKLIWPRHLTTIYSGKALTTIENPISWWGLTVVLFIIFLSAVLLLGWRKRSPFSLGVLLYIFSFLTTANIFVIIAMYMAERFAYLPSAGFCLALASIVPAAPNTSRRFSFKRPLAWLFAAVYLIVLSGLSIARNPDFKSPITLWESAAKLQPGSVRAWLYLAGEYLKAGRSEDAEEAYLSAIKTNPDFPGTYIDYSDFLLISGRPDEAIKYALRGINLPPYVVSPSYLTAASAYVILGRPEEALVWLEKAEPFFKWNPFFWETRGKAFEAVGRKDDAVYNYKYVLSSFYRDPEIPSRTAVLLFDLKRYEEAEQILASQLNHTEDAVMYNLLGVSQALQGKHAASREAFRRAMLLDPYSKIYRFNFEKSSRVSEVPD